MQNSIHTPGPWKSEGINIYAPAPANVRPHIAKVIYGGNADARLIAAAPELLEALEDLLVEMQTISSRETYFMRAAKTAIKKATDKHSQI